MADAPTPQIFCVVTTDATKVAPGGGATVLVAKDEDEQARIAMWISRTVNAATHDLHNGVWLLTVNAPEGGGSAGG